MADPPGRLAGCPLERSGQMMRSRHVKPAAELDGYTPRAAQRNVEGDAIDSPNVS